MAHEELAVGYIRGSFGTAGECKVESASGDYTHIARLSEVTLCADGNRRIFAVEHAEMKGSFLCMKFVGVDSPEHVREYTGWSIVVPRAAAKPLRPDEWYIEDLKQCSLMYCSNDGSAHTIGTIVDVVEGGGGDLLEVVLSAECPLLDAHVKYGASGRIRTVYVPFTGRYIGAVDTVARTVQLVHLWIVE
ncbi:MAG: 16S rRNA processing protein RimM [Treponema sp.]|nr:16S rRNA processing protein RimM [Treponema sp.]